MLLFKNRHNCKTVIQSPAPNICDLVPAYIKLKISKSKLLESKYICQPSNVHTLQCNTNDKDLYLTREKQVVIITFL